MFHNKCAEFCYYVAREVSKSNFISRPNSEELLPNLSPPFQCMFDMRFQLVFVNLKVVTCDVMSLTAFFSLILLFLCFISSEIKRNNAE